MNQPSPYYVRLKPNYDANLLMIQKCQKEAFRHLSYLNQLKITLKDVKDTPPYLEIDEMRDGQIHHYMLPKNSIPYKEPIQEVLPTQAPKIVLEYYPHSRQNKKHKKKPKTHKK